jgi:hypothetical protein
MRLFNTEQSGGTRYSEGKPGNWWCMPLWGLREVARVSAYGAKKYAPFDWQQGQSFSTLMDCAMRHMVAVVQFGIWSRDHESGLLHLAHAAWNILALLTFMATNREDLDDVSVWRGVRAGEEPQPWLPEYGEPWYDGGASPDSGPPSEVPPPASSVTTGDPGAAELDELREILRRKLDALHPAAKEEEEV